MGLCALCGCRCSSSWCVLQLRNPQDSFTFGTVKNSAVSDYFKRQVELSTMYRTMDKYNVDTADIGIQKVKEGYVSYVLLLASHTRFCIVQQYRVV